MACATAGTEQFAPAARPDRKTMASGPPAARTPAILVRPATLLLVAALLLPGPASASAAAGAPGDTAACELRLRPERIVVQEAAVLVTVLASADPGALRGVELASRSGVTVLKAAPARDRDGVVARMALDASGARPGRWRVLLRGGAADCRGTLAVAEGGG